jgi:twitching motility protein PilU
MRTIPQTIPTIDSLGLPQILKDVAMTKRGLVIFVGATGSGKSTSLAGRSLLALLILLFLSPSD